MLLALAEAAFWGESDFFLTSDSPLFSLSKTKETKMKRFFILIFLCSSALAALDIDQWQNLRFSEQTLSNHVYLRGEIAQSGLSLNSAVYQTDSGLVETDLAILEGNSYQSYLPATGSRNYYGLRKRVGSSALDVVPVYYPGANLPAPNQLTKLADDEVNTQIPNYYDIVADYATFSDTKLYTALQNRGGGFPSSGGFLVFNSYMTAIANPDIDPDDPGAIAWALHYVNAAGMYTPGLYKITGTSINDVTRIGDISFQIHASSNTLVMSCDMADLYADADFMAWFDPANPRIGMLSLTARVTLSGVADQDNTLGGVIHPIPLYVDSVQEFTAEISNAGLQIQEDDVYFQAEYSHPNGLFAFDLDFQTASGELYALQSEDSDPGQPMYFRSANLLGSLPEYDNEAGQIRVTRYPDTYGFRACPPFSYVLGLQPVQNLSITRANGNLTVAWDAIGQTLLGNPVTVDSYRLEASDSIDFAEFTVLAESDNLSWQMSNTAIEGYRFFRVLGIKELP